MVEESRCPSMGLSKLAAADTGLPHGTGIPPEPGIPHVMPLESSVTAIIVVLLVEYGRVTEGTWPYLAGGVEYGPGGGAGATSRVCATGNFGDDRGRW
eukprot:scaffold108460_cov17-Prasinocladus_malaysianus.AAC.3